MRKNKNKKTKNKKVEKDVKFHSNPLTQNEMDIIEAVMQRRLSARNLFYSMFSGISYLDDLNFYNLRDDLMERHRKDIIDKLNLPDRAWKMELSEVVSNVKSMWSNLKNNVKALVRDNERLTENDRHFVFYILKANPLLAEVLETQTIAEKPKKLENIIVEKEDYLYHLICRYVRKCKQTISHSDVTRQMQLDQQMYNVDSENNCLCLPSLVKGKRIPIHFNTKLDFTKGNIRVVLDKQNNRLVVHKCIKVKFHKPIVEKNEVGIDKGYATALSSSSDYEYGQDLGELLNTLSKFVNEKNAHRNLYHAEVRNIEKELAENKKLSGYEKKKLKQLLENIKTNNLPNKGYVRERNRLQEQIKSEINHAIITFIETEKPTLIALEDLTFQSASKHGKYFNFKMSMWCKGYLNERLEYHAKMNNIKIEYVSAAYTSQYCAHCGAKLLGRKGKHMEIGICPNCGEINANTNAGKNIKSRLDDKEIKRYTPYKKIKEILDNRYKAKRKRTTTHLAVA